VRWLRHDYMSNTSLRGRYSLDAGAYQAVSSVIADSKKARRIAPAEKASRQQKREIRSGLGRT
jgi:hypothetical protein